MIVLSRVTFGKEDLESSFLGQQEVDKSDDERNPPSRSFKTPDASTAPELYRSRA